MFEWLSNEMAKIKTRNFHAVESPMPAQSREIMEQSKLPPSYKAFVAQFGNARLYRKGSSYMVQVFAVPNDAKSDEGEALLHFGRTHCSLAYFKERLLEPGSESPVFEWQHEQGLRKAADGFQEWLRKKSETARRAFKKSEWRMIEKGPEPFNAHERAIVEARRKFRWLVIGVSSNGDMQFEVHNGSDMVLPYLTLGVRGKTGKVDGGVWLPVSSVLPGETRVIEKDCYKDLLSPSEVDVFARPDPEPEDRDRYWEFKSYA